MLRKLLWGLVSLVFLAGVAHAANTNLVQRDDGRTLFADGDGNTVPAGDPGLSVFLEDVSTASTTYVVAHKAGRVTKIYSVLHGAITTTDAQIIASIISGGSATTIGATVTSLTITAVGSAAGDVDSFAPDIGTNTDDGTVRTNAVTIGDVIAIHTDGASLTDIDVTITVVIE